MVICYEAIEKDGALVLHSSRDEYSTSGIASQLNLLLNQYSDRQEDVDRFAWNLDETITPILRNLVPEQAQKLWTTHECKVKVRDETFSLWYMPEKLLRVSRYKHGKQEVASLYFLGQFFPDDLESPVDINACVGYAQHLIKRLEAKGIRSHRFTSPIALFATDQLESLQLPRVYFDKDKRISVNDTGVPIQALKYAARYGGRLWIEAHQLGLQHVWHYDLRSAFSKCASTLQDTRECQWVNCKGIPKDAVFGTGLARKTVTSRLSPIIMPRDHKVDISPKGTWEDVFMLPEIDWIKKHGKIEIIDGWWGIPKRVKQPLNFIYNKVAPWRGEDRFWDAIAKRMLNGIYGLTLQQYDNGRFGDFWNGMWGSTIDATVAVHVANTIEKYAIQDYVTQIGVDSFSTSHQVLMTDQDLVDWKLSHEGEQLVISSGLIYEAQKKPHGWTLEELKAALQENPDCYRYSKQYTRRLTLGDAVQKNRYIDIGRIIEVDASVDLSGEHDRIFEDGGPRTGRELLDHVWTSEPIEVK